MRNYFDLLSKYIGDAFTYWYNKSNKKTASTTLSSNITDVKSIRDFMSKLEKTIVDMYLDICNVPIIRALHDVGDRIIWKLDNGYLDEDDININVHETKAVINDFDKRLPSVQLDIIYKGRDISMKYIQGDDLEVTGFLKNIGLDSFSVSYKVDLLALIDNVMSRRGVEDLLGPDYTSPEDLVFLEMLDDMLIINCDGDKVYNE